MGEAMMRQIILAITGVLIVTGLWVGVTPAAAAQQSSDWSSELQSCVSERQSLLALFLVDESGSLRDTDPDDQRVTGVQLGISSLSNLVDQLEESIDAPVRLDVSVIGFASVATERQSWGSADAALASTAVTEMADRDQFAETDYANALISTLDSFQTRATAVAAETGVDPCKILYWFTDGEFDIVSRQGETISNDFEEQKVWAPDVDLAVSTEGIIERGRQVICEDTSFASPGIADQLRLAGVITISLALTEQIDPEDEQFLESIAINSESSRCGEEVSIGASNPLADNNALPCEFGTPLDGTKAFPDECERQSLNPSVSQVVQGDPGMDRAYFVVSSGAEEVRLTLTPPAGSTFELLAGDSATSAGARIETVFVSPSVATVEIDFDPSSTAWLGDWVIEVEDPAGSNGADAFRQLTYWGDYRPSMRLAGESLVLGDDGELIVEVVTSTGTAVDVSTFASFDVSIVATNTDGVQFAEALRRDGAFSVVVSTAGATVGVVETEVTVRTQTESGIRLETVTIPGSFRIDPLPGYPTLVTESLLLDPVEDIGVTTFELVVAGDADNSGCVWLGGLVPDDVSSRLGSTFTLETDAPTSEAECLAVPAGELVVLTGVVQTSDPLRGRFNGTIPVNLRSRDDQPFLTAPADVAFSLDVSPDEQRRTLILALMLLAGVLVPLLVTYVLGWFGARFRSGGRLKHLVIPVRVGPQGLRGQDSNDGPKVDRTAFEPGPSGVDGSKEFEVDGTRFGTRAPLNPFSAPSGLAEASGDVLLFSNGRNTGRTRQLNPNQALANLDLPDQWQLSVPIEGDRASLLEQFEQGELSGSLMVLVPFDDETKAEELVNDAHRDVGHRARAALEAIDDLARPSRSSSGRSGGSVDHDVTPSAPTENSDSSALDDDLPSPGENPWA